MVFVAREKDNPSQTLYFDVEETKEITFVKTVWISETNHHEVLLNLALDLLKTCWSFEKLHQAIDTIFYPIIYKTS